MRVRLKRGKKTGFDMFRCFCTHHRNVAPVQNYLIEFRDAASIGRVLVLRHVFENHVHVVVETQEGPDELFIVFHDYVDARSDTFIDEF